MRQFSIKWQSNDFARELIFPESLTFEVQDYSFRGGIPETCTIVAKSGNPEQLRDMLYHLRAPVDIYDDTGTWVWGGYLFESGVQIGGVKRTVSLENYYNAVRVGYPTTGGQTAYTAWVTDATGITNYGRKELTETTASGNPTAAANYATTLLAVYSKIIPSVEVGTGENEATLTCKGWYSTLEWRNYSRAALGLSYWPNPIPNQSKMLGAASDGHHGVSMPCTTNGAYAFDSVTIILHHSGGFPQDITVALREPASPPGSGTLRQSVTTDETAVVWGENTFYFSALYSWPSAHTFNLIISVPSESPSQVYFYGIDASVAGTVLVEYFGLWSSPSPDFSVEYKLHGVLANETRISDAIASHAAFFTGTDTVASGQNTDTYVADGVTLKSIVDGILEMGTSSGTRLLATMTEGRRLRLSAEVAGDASTATLMITESGKLKDRYGGDIGGGNPCNQYCIFWDEIPSVLTGVTRNPDLSSFYVEAATYNVAEDSWTPEARGAIKPFDIFGLSKK